MNRKFLFRDFIKDAFSPNWRTDSNLHICVSIRIRFYRPSESISSDDDGHFGRDSARSNLSGERRIHDASHRRRLGHRRHRRALPRRHQRLLSSERIIIVSPDSRVLRICGTSEREDRLLSLVPTFFRTLWISWSDGTSTTRCSSRGRRW